MTFTTPKTWSVGEFVTKAMLDQQLRDNLNAIWVGTTAGDIDYYSSAVAKTRLAKGAARQVLRMNTGATAPEWGGAIAARTYRSTAQSIPDSSNTTISFDTELTDTDGFWVAGSPTIYTIPYTGFYMFGASLLFDANATGTRQMVISVSEAYKNASLSIPGLTGVSNQMTITTGCQLTAGATVSVYVWQNSGGSLNVAADTARFWISFLGA